jgi:hypothetical protein
MTRAEELTLLLADGDISREQTEELMALIESQEHRATCLAVLKMEALLRGTRRVDLVPATMAWLSTEMERRLVSAVMAGIPASPARGVATVQKSPARPSRKWQVATALAVAAAILAALLFGRDEALPVGQLSAVQGDVQILAGGKKRAAKVGDLLRTGERLLVGFDASAQLDWTKEAAQISVAEMSDIGWAAPGLCELKSGAIDASVVSREGKPPLTFKTADALAKITGTKFSLHRSSGATQLRVSEGRVVLSDADLRGSTDVAAGQYAAASDAVVPSARIWPGDGAGVGLIGEYYNHNYQQMDTQPPGYERLDERIRFQWGKGAPTPVTQAHPEHFGARWTGFIEPRFSESYTFLLVVDDGARMWIDDRQILDAWDSKNARKYYTQPIELTAGRKHKIRVEYCERTQHANVTLFWQSLSQPMEVVPQSQLYPPDRPDLPPPGKLRTLQEPKRP